MGAILGTFGIDWRLLLINAFNFGLLMLALWYFLYKPVIALLEERRRKVSQGMADAAAAAEKLGQIEASRQQVLAVAGKEADGIIAEARSAAEAKERDIIARGESSAQALLKDAEAEAVELKSRAERESKQEVAKLIVLGVEKAMSGK